jgi:putative flippase GtrA
MTYLLCNACGGYYKLQEGESPADFDCCQCGGGLSPASLNEILFQRTSLKCPGCGAVSDGKTFCSYCGTILDTRESSRSNEHFHFHVIEAKTSKNFHAGRKVKTTDPGDWFLRDRLRIDTDGNYFRQELPSMFDKQGEGGSGLNHLWKPGFLIQDLFSGSENRVISFLKLKSPVELGFIIYLGSWLVFYYLHGDVAFQISIISMFIASTITSFMLNKEDYRDIFIDINLLAGLSIFAVILLIFLFIRYSIFNTLPLETPGSELSNTHLILIILLTVIMANIGGLIGVFIRKKYGNPV